MNYSSGMKQNANNSNIKIKILLCLALPLTLAAGCASNPANSYFTDTPVPAVASASRQQAANRIIADEVYKSYLADRSFAYTMVVSVNEGVVTLHGPVAYYGEQTPNKIERQTIDDRMRNLAGVNQVKDELDVTTVSMLAEKDVAVR
jgi:osmotically-inducible protein OsmY